MNNTGKGTNPRWLAYCKSQGNTSEEQFLKDDKKYPGGIMCGFILWIAEKREEFFKKHPERFVGRNISDQDAFTMFCEGKTLKQG